MPVRADLLIAVTGFGLRVATSLRRLIAGERHRFAGLARGLPRKANILDLPRQRFDHASARLKRALIANARVHRTWLERASARLRPHVVARAAFDRRERLIRLERSRARSIAGLLARSRARLDGQAKLLQTLGYHNVLARGFALVRSSDGAMLRRAAEVVPGSALDIEFTDGHVTAQADRNERKPASDAKPPRRRGPGQQGSLL